MLDLEKLEKKVRRIVTYEGGKILISRREVTQLISMAKGHLPSGDSMAVKKATEDIISKLKEKYRA